MMGPRSLGASLMISLLLSLWLGAGPVVYFVNQFELYGLKGIELWDWPGFASYPIEKLVIQSIVRTADGELEIVPTPQLSAELKLMPSLAYAVYSQGSSTPLPGSSPAIAATLAERTIWTQPSKEFSVVRDGYANCAGDWDWHETQFGYKMVALCGYRAGWRWVFDFLKDDVMAYTFRHSYPMFLIVALTVWLTLRRQLRPLRTIAAEAENIDFESLDRRLSLDPVPSELLPLVTAINRALKRLEEGASRHKRFLANAAHELRTPVAVLTARLHDPDESANKNELKRDVRKIRSIVEQLLASTRLDSLEGSLSQIDLVEIAQSVVDSHVRLAIPLGRRIELETAAESIFAAGELRAAESVISNLVDNALRAEPERGTVVVQVGPGPIVAVVDHGAGVDPADREFVFEPFWRKTETTPGTGLGLAIAKDLMTKQGGRISIEETPAGGATFKLSFSTAESAMGGNPRQV